jgi:hypothetical protein
MYRVFVSESFYFLLLCCRCVRSGVEVPESSVGCYACQPEDYSRFKPFFSKARHAPPAGTFGQT